MPHNEDGAGGAHLYMPWWLDNKKLDFPRGYHIELGGGSGGARASASWAASSASTASAATASRSRTTIGASTARRSNFAGRGEMIPNDDTYCEIDPHVVDTYGIPVLRFHSKFSDHEIKQAKHMQETFREIIHEMGGTPLSPMPSREVAVRPRAGRAASSTKSGRRGWATIRRRRC